LVAFIFKGFSENAKSWNNTIMRVRIKRYSGTSCAIFGAYWGRFTQSCGFTHRAEYKRYLVDFFRISSWGRKILTHWST